MRRDKPGPFSSGGTHSATCRWFNSFESCQLDGVGQQRRCTTIVTAAEGNDPQHSCRHSGHGNHSTDVCHGQLWKAVTNTSWLRIHAAFLYIYHPWVGGDWNGWTWNGNAFATSTRTHVIICVEWNPSVFFWDRLLLSSEFRDPVRPFDMRGPTDTVSPVYASSVGSTS